MARTTAVKIGKIREVDPLITDLDPFIEAANQLVTELCVPVGYDDTRLTDIETWLAAHFYSIRDQAPDTEQAGSVREVKQYKLGLALSSTMWGQQVLLLDTAGVFAALSKQAEDGIPRKPATALWLGTEL